MKNEPLNIASLGLDASWRQRWLVLNSWNVLHRISEIEPQSPEEDMVNGPGKAVCGVTGYFMIPGLFSRMGLKRCDHCCDLLGIPRGNGAPFNSDIAEKEGWNEV